MDSGRVRIVRKSKSLEAPIESIAPSTTGKYLFIAFRQCQAPELWLIEADAKLLRKFPKARSHFPAKMSSVTSKFDYIVCSTYKNSVFLEDEDFHRGGGDIVTIGDCTALKLGI